MSSIPPAVSAIIVRLADEEIPVGAISRAFKVSTDDVRDLLHDAVAAGQIIRMPRPDWHPRPRGTRDLTENTMSDDEMRLNCVRTFKVTPLQGAFLSILLRRSEVLKETFHQIIEQRRKTYQTVQTDPKMVDVVICHLRKKLKPYGLEIKTIWACGYYMPPDHREKANNLLLT